MGSMATTDCCLHLTLAFSRTDDKDQRKTRVQTSRPNQPLHAVFLFSSSKFKDLTVATTTPP